MIVPPPALLTTLGRSSKSPGESLFTSQLIHPIRRSLFCGNRVSALPIDNPQPHLIGPRPYWPVGYARVIGCSRPGAEVYIGRLTRRERPYRSPLWYPTWDTLAALESSRRVEHQGSSAPTGSLEGAVIDIGILRYWWEGYVS